MVHKTNWQAVLFDFDGVIADSTAVKVEAFHTLFTSFGSMIQEAVVNYHLDNGGMPRIEKIRHCYTQFVGRPISDAHLTLECEKFADMVREAVIASPLIPGALETLKSLKEQAIPCFVVSGTPHEEMNAIVEAKGLKEYFVEVHGSPRTKPVVVADILQRFTLFPSSCLFVGDALADYQAAQKHGLNFLGIVPAGKPSLFPAQTTTAPKVELPSPP
nr:HAD-IA family hydrolase [uncultured Desulfobulbus sp.]